MHIHHDLALGFDHCYGMVTVLGAYTEAAFMSLLL